MKSPIFNVEKCDSTLPSCKNCVKYGSVCSFWESHSTSTLVSSRTSDSRQSICETGTFSPDCSKISPRSTVSSNGQDRNLLHDRISGPLFPDLTASPNSLGRLNQWLTCLPHDQIDYCSADQDEDLMRNYLKETYRSISNKPSVRAIYRIDIPKEATSHKHLTHAILASSAAHLMHVEINQREVYERKARRHQNLGELLIFFTTAVTTMILEGEHDLTYATALSFAIAEIVDINPSNCHALFATAGLIAFLAFALHSPVSSTSQSPVVEIAEFFTLVRGINTILKSTCFDQIVAGKFSALLNYDWHPPINPLPDDLGTAFGRLRHLNDAFLDSPDLHKTYSTTIQSLQQAFATYSVIAQERALVFSWAVHVTNLYLSLVRERDPLALVILSYYALLLHSINGIWWSEGRGAWLMEAICQELPAKWHTELQLPKDVIQGKRVLALKF